MYPWVTHTHNHLGGQCPHQCAYCYVDNPRFGRPARYTGPIRIVLDELKVSYGSGKTIFLENMGDLFAEAVPKEFIQAVLEHCRKFPQNTYVFQTKNPKRVVGEISSLPPQCIVGTTIESDLHLKDVMGNAPHPYERFAAITYLKAIAPGLKTFVTMEPILSFTGRLGRWIEAARPDFVNIGADSKGNGLPEPTVRQVFDLIAKLTEARIEVRQKKNLTRLKGAGQ